jgi:nucleotidyltransferase substrate binding protein (TIGR01987 family)
MQLNTVALEKAITQLKEALSYSTSPLAEDEKLALHLRAAAIQAFEFTYELSLKMLKRYLTLTEPNPNIINEFSFNEFIRKGYEKGLLLSELTVWKEYRKNRGTTSHTYDEDKALEVFEQIPSFLKDAEYLLNELKKKQALNI